MKQIWMLLFLGSIFVGLQAQSPGDSLMELVNSCIADERYDEACVMMRLCEQQYPLIARSSLGRHFKTYCFEDTSSHEVMASKLFQQTMQLMLDDSLRSQNRQLLEILEKYPGFSRYNTTRRIYAMFLLEEGKEEEGIGILEDVVSEESQDPYPSEAGFGAAYDMGMHYLGMQQYEKAIKYARLTYDKLPERRICSYDDSFMPYVHSLIGLANAGLGQSDSAVHYLSKIAFMEDSNLEAIDTLIALLQRLDSTPLLMQIDQAIDAIHYDNRPDEWYNFTKRNMLDCWISLGNIKLPVLSLSYRIDTKITVEFMYHHAWPYPYSKETCQALMRESPLYLRLTGCSTSEIYPPR